MKKRKNDIFLILAIGLFAALIWFGTYLTRSEGGSVRVTINGELYGEYSLLKDEEIRIGDDQKYNLLEIKDGKAAVIQASCPDKICVHQGEIQYNGQSIICLPNKVVVEVVGGEQSDYDAVAR